MDDALVTVRDFVAAHTSTEYAEVLFRWMVIVFTNALVSFKGRTYVQRHGFPMGTPLAPAAANIFMAVKEDWLGLYGIQPLCSRFQKQLEELEQRPDITELRTALESTQAELAKQEEETQRRVNVALAQNSRRQIQEDRQLLDHVAHNITGEFLRRFHLSSTKKSFWCLHCLTVCACCR